MSRLRRDMDANDWAKRPTDAPVGERHHNGAYTADVLLAAIDQRAGPDIEPMTGLSWEGDRVPRMRRPSGAHRA